GARIQRHRPDSGRRGRHDDDCGRRQVLVVENPHLSGDHNRSVGGHRPGRNHEVDAIRSKGRTVPWDVSDCRVAAREPEGDELVKWRTDNSYVSLRGSSTCDGVTEGQLEVRRFVHPGVSVSDSVTGGGGYVDRGNRGHAGG